MPIAKRALKEGYKVHLATEITTKGKELEKYGIYIHEMNFSRSSTSLLNNIFIFKIIKYFKVKPNLVHLVTIKPIIIGGMALKLIGHSTKLIISI